MTSDFKASPRNHSRSSKNSRRNNQKAWFDANRARYDQHVVGAFRGLLEALSPALLKLNPHFEVGGKTNGNFSRINRDIRFSKDKCPYKSNYYLYVYDNRHDRGHAGGSTWGSRRIASPWDFPSTEPGGTQGRA